MDQGPGRKLKAKTQVPTPKVLTTNPVEIACTITGNFAQYFWTKENDSVEFPSFCMLSNLCDFESAI